MAYNDGIIDEANFINLANECVGAGLLPTGKKMFELAGRYAKQQAVEFIIWAVRNYSIDYEGFSLNCFTDSRNSMYVGNPGDKKEISIEDFYQLFLSHQSKAITP